MFNTFKPWMIGTLALGGLLVAGAVGTGCEEPKPTNTTPGNTPAATGATGPSATTESTTTTEEGSTTDPAGTTGEEPTGTETTPEGSGTEEPAGGGDKPDATGTDGGTDGGSGESTEGAEGAEGAGATIGAATGDPQAQVDQIKTYITEKKWDEAEAALSKLEQRQDQLPTDVQKQVVNARKAVDKGKAGGAESPTGAEATTEEPELTK